MRKLPSFFVVGAQKAGTTTLHDWLVRQPDVCLPVIKETHFFSDRQRFSLGIEWYLKQFPESNKGAVTGEIDPDYMFFEGSPRRIRKWVRRPKIVFIFRHPVERAYSHYLMSLRRGHEALPFSEALQREKDRLSGPGREFAVNHFSYLARGRYCEQIARYREVFPESEFLFVKFNDLFGGETGHATYEGICRFLGLSSSPLITDLSRKSNPAGTARSRLLRDLLHKPSRTRRLLGRLIPSVSVKMKLWAMLDRMNLKPINDGEDRREDLSRIPEEMLESVKGEVLSLQAVTGLNVSDWIRSLEEKRGDTQRRDCGCPEVWHDLGV